MSIVNSMRKNVLIVTQDFPYPLDYAGPIDSFNKISALKANGFNIYLVATIKGQVEDQSVEVMNEFCVDIQMIQRQYSVINFFSILPFQMKSRINDSEIDRICLQLVNVKFDVAICDGYYAIETTRKILNRVKTEKIYLRVNNNEIKYFLSLAKSSRSVLKKMYYISDAIKFYIHERFFLPEIKLSGLLHVSSDEKKHYETKFPKFDHFFLPAAVDVNRMIKYEKRDAKKILFIGSLFMPNNIEGLIWYISNLHGDLSSLYPDYMLVVAGNVRDVNCEQLENMFSMWGNISFVKSPADLTPLYSDAMIFINPMLNGAGVKLKTLNAICAGLPVVSTITGNEGTGLVHDKHILVATEQCNFFDHIVTLIENEKLRQDLVQYGQQFLADTYNQSTMFKIILGDVNI